MSTPTFVPNTFDRWSSSATNYRLDDLDNLDDFHHRLEYNSADIPARLFAAFGNKEYFTSPTNPSLAPSPGLWKTLSHGFCPSPSVSMFDYSVYPVYNDTSSFVKGDPSNFGPVITNEMAYSGEMFSCSSPSDSAMGSASHAYSGFANVASLAGSDFESSSSSSSSSYSPSSSSTSLYASPISSPSSHHHHSPISSLATQASSYPEPFATAYAVNSGLPVVVGAFDDHLVPQSTMPTSGLSPMVPPMPEHANTQFLIPLLFGEYGPGTQGQEYYRHDNTSAGRCASASPATIASHVEANLSYPSSSSTSSSISPSCIPGSYLVSTSLSSPHLPADAQSNEALTPSSPQSLPDQASEVSALKGRGLKRKRSPQDEEADVADDGYPDVDPGDPEAFGGAYSGATSSPEPETGDDDEEYQDENEASSSRPCRPRSRKRSRRTGTRSSSSTIHSHGIPRSAKRMTEDAVETVASTFRTRNPTMDFYVSQYLTFEPGADGQETSWEDFRTALNKHSKRLAAIGDKKPGHKCTYTHPITGEICDTKYSSHCGLRHMLGHLAQSLVIHHHQPDALAGVDPKHDIIALFKSCPRALEHALKDLPDCPFCVTSISRKERLRHHIRNMHPTRFEQWDRDHPPRDPPSNPRPSKRRKKST
ncbi:hypothetical protein SISSUDRAFT_1061369 [Sistotremastrum suecicum HHB10207 ss-3]|uniref:C2H2-type domain-containing protein n=1 Tax=Sistotremastrum suecicum HHB10207 ss-3 TaxID=1314776 RepID=A0A166E4G3_9AGAM|nr:hypothetical protein SISSUDRAFT_1061369 [Sistotremastrum suecicum HHB10207 ss-3]